MGIHHIAIATRDAKATHEFYTGPMGFRLAKVEVGRAGKRGFAKHLFYDTGAGGMIAFWDLHDPDLGDGWSTAIADGLGLPRWTNHIAFDAADMDDIRAKLQRWLDHGLDCTEIDHRWCYSIYTTDPNGTLVEFCRTTGEFDEADRARAREALVRDDLEFEDAKPDIQLHRADTKPAHLAARGTK